MIQGNAISVNELPGQAEALPLRLSPRMHPGVSSFLAIKDLLFELVDRFGSPLNLVFPRIMGENIEDFAAVYKKHRQRGRVYLTSKPCKSISLYREASRHDVGIDVSSEGSLHTAISCGWNGDSICATGPKSKAYITAALKQDALINIDSFEELQRVAHLHTELAKTVKTRITIRVADTGADNFNSLRAEDSAFGIPTIEMADIFDFLKKTTDRLHFRGFSYHASMASDDRRTAAMENLFRLTVEARKNGLKPSVINLGGGFRVMYADSHQSWHNYIDGLKQSVLGNIPPQIWNNSDLGYRVENGVLRGDGAFVNHAPTHTKADELDRWLNFRLPLYGNARFSDLVRDSLLELYIEPGRSLFDQCGITLGRVQFAKKSVKGENIIGLEMNGTNIHADRFKMLTEPLVISRGEGRPNGNREGVYYMGNLCMANDMLRYNKTYPDTLPVTDDLVVFPNTAAYMMDFMESETLMQPTARKIAVTEENGHWEWRHDIDNGSET